MVLALAVLLLHPLASPAVALPALPIQAGQFSYFILTPAPVSAPVNFTDDKTAIEDKTVADDKSSKDNGSSKDNTSGKDNGSSKDNTSSKDNGSSKDDGVNKNNGNTSSDAAKPATSSATAGPFEGGFPSVVGYMPGEFEMTRMSATVIDADPSILAVPPASGASGGTPVVLVPAFHKQAEQAGRGLPKMWFVLGAAEHGAATFDAWSTRRNISEGFVETNPLLKPFANSGALYAVMQIAPAAFDLLSKEMLRSSHPWVRHIWWVPQTGSTVASIFAGAHNMAIH